MTAYDAVRHADREWQRQMGPIEVARRALIARPISRMRDRPASLAPRYSILTRGTQ